VGDSVPMCYRPSFPTLMSFRGPQVWVTSMGHRFSRAAEGTCKSDA